MVVGLGGASRQPLFDGRNLYDPERLAVGGVMGMGRAGRCQWVGFENRSLWASPVFVDSGLSSFLVDHTVF